MNNYTPRDVHLSSTKTDIIDVNGYLRIMITHSTIMFSIAMTKWSVVLTIRYRQNLARAWSQKL